MVQLEYTKRKLWIRKKRKQAEEATEEPRSVRIKDKSDYETPAWLKSILERTSQDHKEEIPDIFDGKSLKHVLTEYAELHMDNEHVFEFETNEINAMYLPTSDSEAESLDSYHSAPD